MKNQSRLQKIVKLAALALPSRSGTSVVEAAFPGAFWGTPSPRATKEAFLIVSSLSLLSLTLLDYKTHELQQSPLLG
jgi:hypothetical protein